MARGGRLRTAREALPLTPAEKKARLERYAQRRFIDGPLTQVELAARLGVTPTTVKRWEKEDVVGEDHAATVARLLSLPVKVLRREGQNPLVELQAEVAELREIVTVEQPATIAALLERVEALEKKGASQPSHAGRGRRPKGNAGR